jgi:thioredoxin reductase (NADPH)
MNPVVYQGMQPGGQLTTTNEVENWPGNPRRNYRTWNDGWIAESSLQMSGDWWATKVDFSGDIHKVWINDTIELHCETVIISTGASAKYLD